MKIIYKNDKTKIEKIGNEKFYFFVEWQGENRKFWLNFPFNLLKITEDKDENELIKRFTVKANSIYTLKEFLKLNNNKLPYNLAMELLYHIGNQLQTLERFYLGIPMIEIDDIIVVDEKKFIFLNDKKIIEIKKQEIEIDEPIKKTGFISPELAEIKKLPTSVSYKSSFYSLGLLTIFCFLNIKIDKKSDIDEILSVIMNTKLYWALLRLIKKNPKDRNYLII
jgi:serine/threonine protein kinase